MTLEELKNLRVTALHTAPSKKSIDWAMDQHCLDPGDHDSRGKADKYRKAMEKLLESGKGKGKGAKAGGKKAGKKGKSSDVMGEFKRICDSLSVTFDPARINDLIKLFSVLRAVGEGIEN
jgi:hypothetical protein